MSRNFPSFIEAFKEYSQGSGAPEKYIFWSAVSGISAALERKVWIFINKTKPIYPNMYIMLVGNSGTRKSTTTDAIVDLISEVPGIHKIANQMSSAAMIESVRDAGDAKTFNFLNKTFRNSSTFAFTNEAATMLKNNTQLQELMTDFYDCGSPSNWSEVPAWNKKTLSGGDIDIYNPCLNFLGCSTPKWLNEIVGESSVEGGFIPRFLLVSAKTLAETTGWVEDHGDSEVDQDFRKKLIQDLTEISRMQGRYKSAIGFKAAYDKIEKEVVAQINLSNNKQPFYNRRLAHTLKVCQVLAADKSNELVMTPEMLNQAYELVCEVENGIFDVLMPSSANKSYPGLVFMWNVMRAKGSWKKGEILASCIQKVEKSEIDKNLNSLMQMGKISYEPQPNGFAIFRVKDSSALE